MTFPVTPVIRPEILQRLKKQETMMEEKLKELYRKVSEQKEAWLEKHLRAIAPPNILRAMDKKWLDKVQNWMESENIRLEEDPRVQTTRLMHGEKKVGTFQVLFDAEKHSYGIHTT